MGRGRVVVATSGIRLTLLAVVLDVVWKHMRGRTAPAAPSAPAPG